MIGSVIVAVSVLTELPTILNPTPLSKARERALLKTASLVFIVGVVEIIAKE